MSIKLLSVTDSHTCIEIHAHPDPGMLSLVTIWYDKDGRSHPCLVVIPTRDLVLSIKQIEEERDATRGASRGTSTEERLSGLEDDVKYYARRTASELTKGLERSAYHRLHTEEITRILRPLYAATTIEDIDFIGERIAEKYLRPTGFKTWDKPL